MNNLLCCILFCLTALCVVNADCPTNPGVEHATFNKEDQCGDVTITCDKGFTMEQGMTCIDGEWKYQEPFCKPPECGYKFTNKTFLNFRGIKSFSDKNDTECDQLCNDYTECSTTLSHENGNCYLYSAPLISVSLDINLDQCIARCTEMEECLMLYYYGYRQRCNMFSATLDTLPGGYDVVEGGDDEIVAEKFCL